VRNTENNEQKTRQHQQMIGVGAILFSKHTVICRLNTTQ